MIVPALCSAFAWTATGADREAIRQHYRELEGRYQDLVAHGEDVSSASALVPRIHEARDRQDLPALEALLNQFEAHLERIEDGSAPESRSADKAAVAPLGATGAEMTLLRAVFARPALAGLLRAKGNLGLIGADGAVGRNKRRFMDVGAQRGVLWNLWRGLLEDDARQVAVAVKAMEYAFEHQQASGYFANTHGFEPRRAVSADAFFLHAFGHIHLVLQHSGQYPAELRRLEALHPKLKSALSWLSANKDELYRQDRKAPNRLAFDGLTFLLNGQVLSDPALVVTGEEFLREALAGQREDGVFVEHGGFDSSYQAVTIRNLCIAWLYLPEGDLRKDVYRAVGRGVDWEKTRIRASGEVEVRGNTRTGLGQEQFLGEDKVVSYPEVTMALAYWSEIGHDSEALRLAERVADFALRQADRRSANDRR